MIANAAHFVDGNGEIWTVDSKGVVRTPMSWLTPRAKHAFTHLVGEAGLEKLLADMKAMRPQANSTTPTPQG